MNLSDAITRVADDSGSNSSVTGVSSRLTRFINRACRTQWMGYTWPFRWKNYRIVTTTQITDTTSSQTCTATNGSRTVNFTGSIGVSSNVYTGHVGWFIYFNQDSILNFYKIQAVNSTSQIVLDQPYQGTSGSSKTFTLSQLDYLMPSEIDNIDNAIFTYAGVPIDKLNPMSIERFIPVPLDKGYPVGYGIYSSSTKQNTYTTGTLAGTINTFVITGSGTSWLTNVFPGDSITIGSYTYTVNTVDSDTQITLYQQQQITSLAGTTYTAYNQFQRIVRIIYTSDQNYTIDLRYLRNYWPLVNNSDQNELMYFYEDAVVKSAAAMELKQKGDPRAPTFIQEANGLWADIRAKVDRNSSGFNTAPIFSYRNTVIERTR